MSCQQASRLITTATTSTTTTAAATTTTTAIGKTQAIAISSSSSSSSSSVHKPPAPPPSLASVTTIAPTNCSSGNGSVLAATPEDPYVFTDTLSTTPPILFNTQKSRARANDAQLKNNKNSSKQATTIAVAVSAAAAAAAAAATTPTHIKAASIANGKLATTPPIIQLNGGLSTVTVANVHGGGGVAVVTTNDGTKVQQIQTNFNSVSQSHKQQQQQQRYNAPSKRATNAHGIVRLHQQQQQKVQTQIALQTRPPTQAQAQAEARSQSQLYSHTPSLWQTPLLLDSVAAAAAAATAVSPSTVAATGTANSKQQQQNVSIISPPAIVAAITPPLNVVSPSTPPATLPSPNAASHTTPASLITPSSVLSSATTTASTPPPTASTVTVVSSSTSPVMVVGGQPLPPSKFHHTTLAQHLQKVECLKKPKRVATLPLAANVNLIESSRSVRTLVNVSQPPPLKAFGTMAVATKMTSLQQQQHQQQPPQQHPPQQQPPQQQQKHSADDDNDLNEIPVNVIFRKPIANDSAVTTVKEHAAAIVAIDTTSTTTTTPKAPKSLKIVPSNMKGNFVPSTPAPKPTLSLSASVLSPLAVAAAAITTTTTTVTPTHVTAATAMSKVLVQTHFNGGTQSSPSSTIIGQGCIITQESTPVIKSVIIPQKPLCPQSQSLPLFHSPQPQHLQQQATPLLQQQQQQQLSSTKQGAVQPKRKTMAAGGVGSSNKKSPNAASKRNNKKMDIIDGVISSLPSQMSSGTTTSTLSPPSISVMPATNVLLSKPSLIDEVSKHKMTLNALQKQTKGTALLSSNLKENIPQPPIMTGGETSKAQPSNVVMSVDEKATKIVNKTILGNGGSKIISVNDENTFCPSTMMDKDDYLVSDKPLEDEQHTYCLQRHWIHAASTLVVGGEPLSCNQREERIAEHKSLLRRQALQLLATRSLQKQPISLARQRLQCVDRLLQKCHIRNMEQESPVKKCLFPNCNESILAMSSHCLRHIVNNTKQQIFAPCIAKNSDGQTCRASVFDLWHDVALCNEHKSLRNQYEMVKIEKATHISSSIIEKETTTKQGLMQMLSQQCSNISTIKNVGTPEVATGTGKPSIPFNPNTSQTQRKRKVINGGTGNQVGRPQKRSKKSQLQLKQSQQQEFGVGGEGLLLHATTTTLPPISAVLQRKSSTTSLESITSNSQSSNSQVHYVVGGGASSAMHTGNNNICDTSSFASLPALAPLSNTHNVMLSMSNNNNGHIVSHDDVAAVNFGNLNMMINATTNNFKGDNFHDQDQIDFQEQIAAHFASANSACGVNHNNNNIINQYNSSNHCINNNSNMTAMNYLNLSGNANFATAVNSSDFNPSASEIFISSNNMISNQQQHKHQHHHTDDIITKEMFSICENSSAYASSEDTGLGGISESELMGPQETDDIPLVDPRLLEEHDLANVLNNLPVDAFNELFTSVRQDECDEMDRQLELADKHIRSLQQSMGSDSDFLGDFLDVNDDILADTAADICSKMDIVSSVMNSPDTSGIDAATLFADSSNGAASNSDIGIDVNALNDINCCVGSNGGGIGSNGNLGSQLAGLTTTDNCTATSIADIRGLVQT